MTLNDIVTEVAVKGGIGLIVLLTVIQIAPIKINPWSKLAAAFGRAINKEVITEVKGIKVEVSDLRKDLNKLDDQFHENTAIEARDRILRFGDEVSHGVNHSREHFQQILADITFYDHYCDTHHEFANNMTKLTAKRIEDDYLERDKNGSFL